MENSLTTWDIPIDGILCIDGKDFYYRGTKRKRVPRLGVIDMQQFVASDKTKQCFIYGVKVTLINGRYWITSQLPKE